MAREAGSVPHAEPLAYFLTWTSYGSWLPGDERGSFDRSGQFQSPSGIREELAQSLMTETPAALDVEQRQLVENTISDHCQHRQWIMHAVNCRVSHVHVVVTATGTKPEGVMEQLKAWCTRRLKDLDRTRGVKTLRQKWWTQRGSKRWLNTESDLESVIRYVSEEQGEPTPDSI